MECNGGRLGCLRPNGTWHKGSAGTVQNAQTADGKVKCRCSAFKEHTTNGLGLSNEHEASERADEVAEEAAAL